MIANPVAVSDSEETRRFMTAFHRRLAPVRPPADAAAGARAGVDDGIPDQAVMGAFLPIGAG